MVAPALTHADGIWLDGVGPDNGAYMCSGSHPPYGAKNSPLVQSEIDAHRKAQTDTTTELEKYLVQNGGWVGGGGKCFDYKGISDLPTQMDGPTDCAAKLVRMAAYGANHSNYNLMVAYGSRTGGRQDYNDSNIASTVAAFMLMRGQHWLFSIGTNGGKKSASYPPYDQDPGSLTPATAKILTSDHGAPKGGMTAVAGKTGVFQRVYEKAIIALDCSDFSSSFLAQ